MSLTDAREVAKPRLIWYGSSMPYEGHIRYIDPVTGERWRVRASFMSAVLAIALGYVPASEWDRIKAERFLNGLD